MAHLAKKDRMLLPGLWVAGLMAIFSFSGLMALLLKFTGHPHQVWQKRVL